MYSPGIMKTYFIQVPTECVSCHLTTFHLAQPMQTSWKLHETLQHYSTLQGTKKEVWTCTYSGQTTNR
jgi:hypothetical protein